MIQRHAGVRREASGKHGDAPLIVQVQARLGVRQRQHAGKKAEARIKHLGIRAALRRLIVEQHDRFAERHRACRPREQRAAGEPFRGAEQSQAVDQRGHMAAGDQHGSGWLERPQHGCPRMRHRDALRGLELAFELVMHGPDREQVRAIEPAQRCNRLPPCRQQHGSGCAAIEEFASRLLGMAEAQGVQLLHFLQTRLSRAMREPQRAVGREDIFRALIDAQIFYRCADMGAQFVDLSLSLLPTRADADEWPP